MNSKNKEAELGLLTQAQHADQGRFNLEELRVRAPFFISFEGIDGSGKTTQLKRLERFLRTKTDRIVVFREPGGTAEGEVIRSLLKDAQFQDMGERCEFLLFSAARAQLVQRKIQPSLAAGYAVITDRFADSSLAYQGYGRGQELEALEAVTRYATQGLGPQLTLYFDLSPEKALKRMQVRGNISEDRLDAEGLCFMQKTYEGYQRLIQKEPERFVVLDADQSEDALFEQMMAQLVQRGILY